MNIKEALRQDYIESREGEILLCHVLDVDRAYLLTHGEDALTEKHIAAYESFLARREDGEPIAYLLGKKAFWDIELTVTEDTLIPRPDTELLVDLALALLPQDALLLADLGTGSGAIALSLAKARPEWAVHATDASEAALQVAQTNQENLDVDNVTFSLGDWYRALEDGLLFDAIISNPPYIAADDPHLETDIRFEPQSALVSGKDGLNDLRKIILGAKDHLKLNGMLMLEHGYDQADAVKALFEENQFTQVQQYEDLAGHLRVTVGLV